MNKIPEDIVLYAKSLLNTDIYYSPAELEQQLNDRRNKAIDAIQYYKEFKKRLANAKKARIEISEWLKENGISVIPDRVTDESIIMETGNN